jgi:hypothetical protein
MEMEQYGGRLCIGPLEAVPGPFGRQYRRGRFLIYAEGLAESGVERQRGGSGFFIV